jgi:hypothetical protein
MLKQGPNRSGCPLWLVRVAGVLAVAGVLVWLAT